MGYIEKSTKSVSIIGRSDGPTSVFLAGTKKRTFKQRLQKRCFELRKKWYALWIKPGAHTMDELIMYVQNKYGFTEVAKDTEEYMSPYISLRASFILRYKPELLGEYAGPPELKSRDEEGIREFERQLAIREKLAAEIPESEFHIDYHILEKHEGDNNMHFYLETVYDYIGGGFSGSGKKGNRIFEKIYKDAYRYYGVTKEDINNNTKRYERLLKTLAVRH